MAIARIAVRTHSRRRGHSAAAAWAYRSGRCFTCARTGREHDYTPRSRRSDEIVKTGLAWTGEVQGTPALARDEQQLLDAIEHAERRHDAKILRDIQLALPAGLGTETLVELVREYAQWVADEYHTLAMWAIHRPGRIGDGRNIHAHVLVPTRELEVSGAAFGRKLRVLDDFKSGPAEICRLRNRWCESANARLECAGTGTRIHAGRRLDAPPMPTIPERFVVREYAAKRAAGLAIEPMRVAELAELGDPENRAMARIAAHVEAGYDVPASERVYEEKARPYYERAREHDATDRDAAHYAGLSIVRQELEAANTELADLEARIEALGAANAPGPLAPEPLVFVPARSVEAPPLLEDDDWAHEPALVPRPLAALDAAEEPALPEPLVFVPARSVETPPALEDDDWAREPALVPRPLAALDAAEEPALPEPLVFVPARSVETPPALEDDDWAREPALVPQPLAALDAVGESALPEPLVVVAARPVEGPPALEDDDWARKPALAPQPLAALDAVGKSALPEPLVVVAARPVEGPPALEDDDWARKPALVPQPLAALDAVGKSALPEPLVVVAARAVGGPPALEDDDEALERELERLVEDVERMHDTLELIETKVARELSVPDWLAATIEESMRREVLDAPQWEPRLADIPRSTETSQVGVVVWRIVLFAEMEELRECGNDRKRIERHIANVRERAKTDAPWRSRIIARIAGSISPSYGLDLERAGYFDPEPPRDEAKDALLLRWRRQCAAGGLDAWSEQSVARAAGLEVDFSFGEWSRARESGLLAEDVLRLHLHDAVRTARRLKRTFPGKSGPGPGGPTTLREWHRGLARVVSDVRERLRDPKTRDDFMTDLAMRMVPDLRAEWARGGEGAGRGPMPEASAAPAERDRTLIELVRQRARAAGIVDDLEDGDRARLGRELDERLEPMLQDMCLFGLDQPATIDSLSPDGVPAFGKTADAIADELKRRFRPALDQIRAGAGSGGEHEHRRHVLERCRKYVSNATNRRRVVDRLVAAAGAHYEAEWLPPLESADPRGARERGELRAELEAQILASAEAAGEARILGHAGIRVTVALPGVDAFDKLLDDGGFVDGITYGRPEREPVRSAVGRWREHCETHLGAAAAKLLEAMWPEHWERYRKTRRRSDPERVPTREERGQAVLDATRPAAPTPPRSERARDQDDGQRY